jgi:RNA polymerase sigma-70 factor (family 1)
MYNHNTINKDNDFYNVYQIKIESSFVEIYNKYKKKLIAFAYSQIENIAVAEDIVHDVFLSLYARRVNVNIEISVYAYLIKSIKYKIINLRRKQLVEKKYRNNNFFENDCENDFAKNQAFEQTTTKLKNALSKMPDKCKEAFILSREVGLSQKEIARTMSISCSTVEKHIVKALKIVRSELSN